MRQHRGGGGLLLEGERLFIGVGLAVVVARGGAHADEHATGRRVLDPVVGPGARFSGLDERAAAAAADSGGTRLRVTRVTGSFTSAKFIRKP